MTSRRRKLAEVVIGVVVGIAALQLALIIIGGLAMAVIAVWKMVL